MIVNFVKSTLDFLLPPQCIVCGTSLVKGEDVMCLGCLEKLPRTNLHLNNFNEIHHRISIRKSIETAGAWFYYAPDSPYADLIRTAKYHDRPKLAFKLGRIYARELEMSGFDASRLDTLLPVGMHYIKQLKRTYNQSVEIAKGMSSVWNVPVNLNIKAVRSHKTQTHISGSDRSENIKDIFEIHQPQEIAGKSVAIVDDIITTGSTIGEAVKALIKYSNPAEINVFSLGLTYRNK